MGQRSGRCVGCRVSDIHEFEELMKYAYNADYASREADSAVPRISPDNAVASVVRYLAECAFPVTMRRVRKYCGTDEDNIYRWIPAMKFAKATGAVKIVDDSGKNRYKITEYGRGLAELLSTIEKSEIQ